jgi:hypothetical protein
MPAADIQEVAVLFEDDAVAAQTENIAKLLRFFGVQQRSLTVDEFVDACSSEEGLTRFRLICSTECFLSLLNFADEKGATQRCWKCVHSVFVYGRNGLESLRSLARRLDPQGDVSVVEVIGETVIVTNKLESFCRIMSGLQIPLKNHSNPVRVLLGLANDEANILSVGVGSVLAGLEYQQVPVFISTADRIVDLETELDTGIFDLRDHLLSTLPIVLFVKWAFPNTCWNSPETSACLVIDDPVLKPSHGFVDFAELLSLMKRHRFSTNIAFIPWNWRRSDPRVVGLFTENPESYSISVHGCDHTHAEFGSADFSQLSWKISRALRRMNDHERRTGICHDRVMVFPQGVFSIAAMEALKQTELIAAINNDTISADPSPCPITIADVWDVAVMKYNNFALFTRRYPWEGLENFAFDAFLGKPALVIIHHDSCRNHCRALIEFIERFNALRSAPAWRGLGEVVRRSCRQRPISENAVEVQMYAGELRLDNRSGQQMQFRVQRTESIPSAIRNIRVASRSLEWNVSDGHVCFELELDAGDNAVVSVEYNGLGEQREKERDIIYEARTMLRRYLCEARDNYVTKYKLILKSTLGADPQQWN